MLGETRVVLSILVGLLIEANKQLAKIPKHVEDHVHVKMLVFTQGQPASHIALRGRLSDEKISNHA